MVKKSNPQALGSLLKPLLERAEATYDDTAHRVWEVWPLAVGENVARRAGPVHFHGGVLTVAVTSSPWLQQLFMLREQMLAALAQELGAPVVRELRLRLGAPDTQSPKPEAARPPPPPLSLDAQIAIDAQVSAIKDPDLRKAIRGARIRAKREALRGGPEAARPPGSTADPDHGGSKMA